MEKRFRFTGTWFIVVFAFFLLCVGGNSEAVSPKIGAGYNYTIALKTDGSLWAWGLTNLVIN